MKRIKVIVADDDRFFREFLIRELSKDIEIEVVGYAADGEEVVELTRRLKPDLVLMDIVMPKKDGFQAVQEIMATNPVPIIMITAFSEQHSLYDALLAGALDMVPKPRNSSELLPFIDAIRRKVKLLSGVKPKQRPKMEPPKPKPEPPKEKTEALRRFRCCIVAIGASTGGPKALAEILSHLPEDFPTPILIVQHIWPGFENGLATWLNSVSKLKVKVAQNNEPLETGTVYISPTNANMRIKADWSIELTDEKHAEYSHYPSVDVLFFSVAKHVGDRAVGVILTGMERDGAKGLLEIKKAGGYTIAQDEKTSVVFGMPKAAIEIGAALEVLPIQEIAPRLVELCSAKAHGETKGD